MGFIEYIRQRASEAEKALEFSKKKLAQMPSERLWIREDRGRIRYYAVSEGNLTYIKDKDKLKILQEKVYYDKLKHAAEKESAGCRRIEQIMVTLPDYETVFSDIPELKRTLISRYTSQDKEELIKEIDKQCKAWRQDSASKKKPISDALNFTTLNGEKVRSKSELIIADRLKSYGIPYYYEKGYIVADSLKQKYSLWFPDFQVFNKRTADKFYWEHFGLMDNAEYCASCQFKLETYARHGIVQGKNLIITMESSQHSLNTEYVDCLIKTFLE